MKNFPTGIKDLDRKILKELDTKSMLEACKINDYTFNKVCSNDFFKALLLDKYPDASDYLSLVSNYKGDKPWKQMFLLYIYYVDKMKKEFDFDFKSGDPYFYYDALSDKQVFVNGKYQKSFYLDYDDLGLFLRNKLAKSYNFY